MSENANPEYRPADPERRNKLREWLVDAPALVVGALAVFHCQPEGFAAGLIVFVGAYTLASVLQGLDWVRLGAICDSLLIVLAPAIHHLGTAATVPAASFTGLFSTFLLTGTAQAYRLWELWPATGTLTHPLAPMCAAWLTLPGIRIVAGMMFVNGRAPQAS